MGIATGHPADFISLDADHPALIGRGEDRLIDSLIFAEDVDEWFICGPFDLVEPVGDENNGDAGRLQISDHGEQTIGLSQGQ